ncbi:hypothetical protein DY000_02033114 [Brassica cretica]|uniref:Uncharacterized protein n=1 Tax=Brassica cretica TaxID=69181 RepID=A0ABQ7DYJ1_BRACR|nr:hypothetical protein DY000_02033114 [Brassica cretica]
MIVSSMELPSAIEEIRFSHRDLPSLRATEILRRREPPRSDPRDSSSGRATTTEILRRRNHRSSSSRMRPPIVFVEELKDGEDAFRLSFASFLFQQKHKANSFRTRG